MESAGVMNAERSHIFLSVQGEKLVEPHTRLLDDATPLSGTFSCNSLPGARNRRIGRLARRKVVVCGTDFAKCSDASFKPSCRVRPASG